jgi:competence protein ComEA
MEVNMNKFKISKKLVGSIAILVVLSLFLIVGIMLNKPKTHKVNEEDIFVEAPVSSTQKMENKTITVYINGEVKNPGVFTLKLGSIVDDLVKAAGGLTSEANLNTKVNLAKKLKDEDYIYIDKKIEGNAQNASVGNVIPVAAAVTSINSQGKVNINIASMEELDKLPGIGPVTAQKIIDYREKNGSFSSIEDLNNIPGIGDKTLDKFRDSIDIR